MNVGLWGAYFFGNYGDDLMAILFARKIRELGLTPLVYGLDPAICYRHDIPRTDSVAELFDDTALVIVGGGGLLVRESRLRNVLTAAGRRMEREFERICSERRRHPETPVCPLSVGGDGVHHPTGLVGWRRRFWQEAVSEPISVRLPEDIEATRAVGKASSVYPDVVLAAPEMLGVRRPDHAAGAPLRIGLNLKKRTGRRLARLLVEEARRQHANVEIIFMKTHLPGYTSDYELSHDPGLDGPIDIHRYADPLDTLEFIASLDILVSSKLHVGATAIAVGVPFLSFEGPPKARSFLRGLGAEEWVWTRGTEEALVDRLLDRSLLHRGLAPAIRDAIDEATRDSMGHLRTLERCVDLHIGAIGG